MESNPLRRLFRVSSPRTVEQRVAPQPTENVYFEIPSGMIEKLLANPFAEDGTLHHSCRWNYKVNNNKNKIENFTMSAKDMNLISDLDNCLVLILPLSK